MDSFNYVIFHCPWGSNGGSRVLNTLTDNVRKCSAFMRMGFQSGAASVQLKQTQATEPKHQQNNWQTVAAMSASVGAIDVDDRTREGVKCVINKYFPTNM